MHASRERGQASPEWIGLVLLVALVLAGALALGARLPGLDLARSVAAQLVCAAGLGDGCGGDRGALTLAYGAELAGLLTDHAPGLDYEDGMRAVPVDFRSCRADACAEGPASGPVRASLAGERVTAFVHVIDCRDSAEAARAGYDCSGGRGDHVYLQYWLYYPGSATARAVLGDAGAHPDDFESFQVRIASGGAAQARASSHHGYNGRRGDWLSDTGVRRKDGWTDATGRYLISGGSHAGRVGAPAGDDAAAARWTAPEAIRLIPLEPLVDEVADYEFAVTPPWAKRVYRDPEDRGTG